MSNLSFALYVRRVRTGIVAVIMVVSALHLKATPNNLWRIREYSEDTNEPGRICSELTRGG